MKPISLTGFALCLTLSLAAQDRQEFRNPSAHYRPKPLWFWNDTRITREGIDEQMAGFVRRCGYGGFSILPFGPRLAPEYLSGDYFELYRHTARKAAELGVTLSLYDEYGFPSGSGGWVNADGVPRFANRYPDLTLKRLDKIEEELDGGAVYDRPLSDAGTLMAVVAMETSDKRRIDLSDRIADGRIVWQVPDGRWKVMQFVCVEDPDRNMDYLSADAARAYIEMTHEAYYGRMPEEFGTTITGTFFDEPTLYRAEGRCWTPSFNDDFARAYGSSPTLLYPALWYDIGPETASARNAMFSLRAEQYAAAYPKLVSEWSRSHGTLATGHQDNEERENPVGTSADLMKCFKYQDIPGIDKIGGDRPAERFYKVVSSAAVNWDRSLAMSETYGAMGNIPWDTIYRIAQDQYAKGINMLIPHAVWYDDRNVTFLPELSHRNPLYRDGLYEFNTFLGRLNVLLQNDARLATDIAVLYPIETMQAGHRFDGPLTAYEGGVRVPDMDYVQVGCRLTDRLGRDFIYLHPEVLASERTSVAKRRLLLEGEHQPQSLRTLVVPSSEVVSAEGLAKIEAFFDAGGQVIFTTRLPARSSEPGRDAEVAERIGRMLPEPQSAGRHGPLHSFAVGRSAGRGAGNTRRGPGHRLRRRSRPASLHAQGARRKGHLLPGQPVGLGLRLDRRATREKTARDMGPAYGRDRLGRFRARPHEPGPHDGSPTAYRTEPLAVSGRENPIESTYLNEKLTAFLPNHQPKLTLCRPLRGPARQISHAGPFLSANGSDARAESCLRHNRISQL